MITNERQYRITKSQLANFEKAVKEFDFKEAKINSGSDLLVKAEFDALKSEYQVLGEQVQEYEALRSGSVKILKANSLKELPNILIRARIAQGLSQRQLADLLQMKEQQIQRYESEEYASASLTRLSEIADALKLNINEVAEFKPSTATLVEEPRDQGYLEWARFPVKEMYRRGWFNGFSGSLAAAVGDAEALVKDFVGATKLSPSTAFHHKRVRSGSEIDQYALFAWECRILSLANKTPEIPAFKLSAISDDWILNLVKQSQFPDGPVRAKKYLENIGVYLVIEPQLPSTHLDGAAMLPGNNPVIGLTLRYDRIDNFWFVLLHELGHVVKHLRKGKLENIFDDLDSDPDDLEKEADDFALQSLISNSIWETALPRYVRNEASAATFAKTHKIDPAIVAGRIRHEAKNFIILNSLVGQGQIRKQFPDVKFGV